MAWNGFKNKSQYNLILWCDFIKQYVLETYVHFSKDAVKFTHLYSICIQCSKHVCNLVSTCWILISCLMSKKIFTFTSSQWAGTFHLVWLDTKLRPLDISKSQLLHQSPLLVAEFVMRCRMNGLSSLYSLFILQLINKINCCGYWLWSSWHLSKNQMSWSFV